MGRNIRLAFWIVVLVQVVALLGFAGVREFTLRTGQEIVLQTVPVDPRDLFRGDYVVLSYEISRVSGCCFSAGDTAYVSLAPKGEVWQAVEASRRRPSGNALFLRGRVLQVAQVQPRPGPPGSGRPSGPEIEVEYGIESYFVPEGTGRDIEESIRQAGGKAKVRVIVDGFGTAVVKGLVLSEARTP